MPMGDPSRRIAASPGSHGGSFSPIAWRATSGGDCLWFSPEWTALTGQAATDSQGIGWIACVHPDDRGRLLEAWRRARTGRVFTADLRIRIARDGSYRWFRTQALPTGDASQVADGWAGHAIDVSDLYDRLEGEATLRATLHHRIRNTLAVIRSIARRTAENSETVEDYRNHFDGRLGAFARTQSHIMRTGVEGVDLEGLLADELLAHQVGGRVTYSGPEARLPPRIADQLGIALHELTENAMQHGALSREHGRLEVRWWITGDTPDRLLHIDWREDDPDGGFVAPDTEGFGLELLTRSLRYEVDADVDIVFADHGFACTIRLPFA